MHYGIYYLLLTHIQYVFILIISSNTKANRNRFRNIELLL